MKSLWKNLKGAFIFSVMMLLLCGLIYPFALTGVSQLMFHDKANGSIIEVNDKKVGSVLVGQDFDDPRLFKCRPSAVNYNTYEEEDISDGSYSGVSSGSQNFSNTNPELKKRVQQDIQTFLKANPDIKREELPADLFTASGSGLDPHITKEAAKIQIPGIVKASGLSYDEIENIVEANTEEKILGVFGEQRVNVLKCNLEIAKLIGII